MRKILITGAYGYLGSRLCYYFAKQNYKVTAFGRSLPSSSSNWVSLMDDIIEGDIRDEAKINNLATKNFDIVIHLISSSQIDSAIQRINSGGRKFGLFENGLTHDAF